MAVILEALKKHNYVSTACELAGISEATFYNWLDKAETYKTRLLSGDNIEEVGGRYVEFFDAVKQARAGSEGELLGRIDTAGSVPTVIEERTIEHTLKDGTNKTEVIERWKPADWTANAWILERTRWEKYGQHSSLDIQQAGVIFIERLQRARSAQVIEGGFKVLEEIAKEPTTEEVMPERTLITASAQPHAQAEALTQAPRRRPIFELISRKRDTGSQKRSLMDQGSHNNNVDSETGKGESVGQQRPSSAQNSAGRSVDV